MRLRGDGAADGCRRRGEHGPSLSLSLFLSYLVVAIKAEGDGSHGGRGDLWLRGSGHGEVTRRGRRLLFASASVRG